MNQSTDLRRRVAELEAREEQFKQAEASLARLATYPEQNPNPVIETDLDGVVTYRNPAAIAHFPDLSTAGIAHPLLADMASTIDRLRAGDNESHQAELEIADRIYERKTIYMVQSNLVRIFASDITEIKQTEASLARLATFPEENPNPVIETDLDGVVTYLNPVALAHFPDLPTVGLAHPVLANIESIIERLRAGDEESHQAELEIGDRIYEQKTTYMAQSNLVRIFASDITQLKRLQAQLRKSLNELEQTNKDLLDTQVQLVQSEKMAAMASLVAGIAHEINTPIGAISSVYDTLSRAVTKLRQVLADGSQEDKPRGKADAILQIISDASNVIRTGSERVTAIVQSLRSFAHLDQAELKSVNIHDGLEDTVGLLQHNLGTRIEVIWNLGDVDPIICYPGRLNQVFLCVMENAIDAIEEQGQIEISTWREGDELFVTIRDSGIGIPEENLSKIFQPAFTTKGPGIGTGLGLSICYQIVQEHKGRIEVQSKVGEGSTLTMVLSYGFTGFGLV